MVNYQITFVHPELSTIFLFLLISLPFFAFAIKFYKNRKRGMYFASFPFNGMHGTMMIYDGSTSIKKIEKDISKARRGDGSYHFVSSLKVNIYMLILIIIGLFLLSLIFIQFTLI